MNHKSTIWLLRKIEHARDLGLIDDYQLVNLCEIDSFLTIHFHPETPLAVKERLAGHIRQCYDDIVSIRFNKTSKVMVVQYVDWETLPNKVAF